jgi:acetyl-CoA acetyltransferase
LAGLDCAIAGLGVTDQGALTGRTSLDLKVEALELALFDAGLRADQIDGFVFGPGMTDFGKYGQGGETVKRLGLEPSFVHEIQTGGCSATACLSMACWAIEHGHAQYVAVDYGDNPRTAKVTVGQAGGAGSGTIDRDTYGAYGMYSPAADHAFAAQRHMHLYGTTREQLGHVVLTQRDYALMRSDAFLHDRPLTIEEYLEAKPIAEPFSRHDYCLVADGGSALIVTSTARARDLARGAVRIAGIGMSSAFASVHARGQYDRLAVDGARDHAFAEAQVTIEDIDVAEIYDCFSIAVLLAIESYGFCERGEGGAFIADGNLRLDGQIPTNTSGGELAWSYQQGFTPLVEGVRQVRGDGAATQVPDAETVLVTGHGGVCSETGNMDYAEACVVLQADR